MAISFSESEISQMYKLYQDTLNSLHRSTTSIVNKLCHKAEEMSYEPVVRLSKEAIEYHNSNLKQDILHTLEEWRTSESSFTTLLESMHAGEEAVNRAKELENQIIGDVENWKPVSNDLNISTEFFRKSDSDLDEIMNHIGAFTGELDDQSRSAASALESRCAENTIYASIRPVVMQSIAIVAAGFGDGIAQSYQELFNEIAESEAGARSRAANAHEAIKQASASVAAEGLSILKAHVKTILE